MCVRISSQVLYILSSSGQPLNAYCEEKKERKKTPQNHFGKAFLWVCLKENQPEIMSTKQFHVRKWDSAVIQGLNPNSDGESVVLHGLPLEYPFYEGF